MAEWNWREAALEAIDQKTKPPGSLGRLEEWAVRLAVLQQTLEPRVERAAVLIFGADHGVTAEGVSAYPREVTAQMMRNFAAGGAAINVLARSAGLDVEVVDVGVDADLEGLSGIVGAKVRRGSRNFAHEPAMTPEELEAALEAGRQAVDRLHRRGTAAVGLGEMGIGNTTAAAALLSALTAAPADRTVGRGTGVDDDGLRRKLRVVAAALERHAGLLGDPASCLRAVGGLEIAALAGAAREASRRRIAVVADGFISTVAVLAAVRIAPEVRPAVFAAHRSAERGHDLALDALGESPLIDLRMRLGEGTGAALALPVLRAAAAVLREMATFSQARVSQRRPEEAGAPPPRPR